MKYLLLLLVLVLVFWVVKTHQRRSKTRSGRSATNAAPEDMVQCAQCGVHLPRSESLMSGQLFYCTPEHRRLHQQDK